MSLYAVVYSISVLTVERITLIQLIDCLVPVQNHQKIVITLISTLEK
jgi:hypothetical protein